MFISSHLLHSPIHLGIQIFPLTIKNKIEVKILEFLSSINKSPFEYELLKNHLNSVIRFMYAKDKSCHFQLFLNEMLKSDQYREQRMSDSMPEFYEMIKDYVKK